MYTVDFRRLFLITCFSLLFFTACTSGLQAKEAAAPPENWQVSIAPALSWMRPVMNICAQNSPDKVLSIVERDSSGDDNIYLSWGELDGQSNTSIYLIGSDRLVVIVNKDNPATRISYSTLQTIYSGRAISWQEVDPALSDQVPVQVWQYGSASQLFKQFSLMLDLMGQRQGIQNIVPSPQAMIEAISSDPAAIGLISERWLTPEVKLLQIDDAPVDKIKQPILAYLKEKPGDFETTWLLCLQNQLITR